VRGVRRHVNISLLRLIRVRCFTSSVVTPWGYKSRWSLLHSPISSHTIHRSLLTSFPMPKKKEREKERKRGKKGDYWDLESVASPSFSSHGKTRLDPFQGHAGSPAKPHELGVYDGDGARGLPSARGPRIPCACGRICGDFSRFLQAGIQCAITPVPLLTIITVA
jgi:hypothetical protein